MDLGPAISPKNIAERGGLETCNTRFDNEINQFICKQESFAVDFSLPRSLSFNIAVQGGETRGIPAESGREGVWDSGEKASPADGDRIVFGTIGEASNLITYLSWIPPPTK